MPAKKSLKVLKIESPCQADWNDMIGDGAHRFCNHCNKMVHDLSAMPAYESERLICNDAGELCVRFQVDPAAGTPITLDYAARPTRRRAITTLSSIIVSALFSAGWLADKLLRPQAPPSILMGAIRTPLPKLTPPPCTLPCTQPDSASDG